MIPAIENLGVTRDQHDTIDLTDNAITVLGNIPLSPRLHSLLLANNSIHSIHPSIPTSVPNLTTLTLTNNAFAELGDLEILGKCTKLEYLALLGCPVREKKWYRQWVIFNCRSLRVLDFERIKDKERKAARQLFLTPDNLPTSLHTTLSQTRTAASVNTEGKGTTAGNKTFVPGASGRLMTAEEKNRIREALARATSAEEVKRLEQELREGYLPS
ncbi:leucine-rich repeat-domain-containing protein [Cantharellus anzutake]|uniref:leucine-rich repeat-domain-containing protein n=1 Tax=Cantharellus anzutake TaxID=1750568 RepID=UPI001903FFD3|nr:leucine-rich repeat-domain-containing protein [Cantharellus anzutake]KAF8343768.1 leucine-rich repeat-domain-containing protein [Cantharellus anzutake]